jgi:hypothetical protein
MWVRITSVNSVFVELQKPELRKSEGTETFKSFESGRNFFKNTASNLKNYNGLNDLKHE